jgi:hypothetical protein
MFCAPELIFDNTEGVGSRFHVLSSRARFGRYSGYRVLFSCFALLDSFLAVPSASCPVLMFCPPALIFGGTESTVSRCNVLRTQTHFRRHRERRVPFSCFALSNSFSTVPRAPGPIVKFLAPGLIFGGIEGVGSRFHVLCSRTHFRRYQGRRVPLSCFALPDSFSAVPRALRPVFYVLRSRIHFRRYRGRRVPFSCFALLD